MKHVLIASAGAFTAFAIGPSFASTIVVSEFNVILQAADLTPPGPPPSDLVNFDSSSLNSSGGVRLQGTASSGGSTSAIDLETGEISLTTQQGSATAQLSASLDFSQIVAPGEQQTFDFRFLGTGIFNSIDTLAGSYTYTGALTAPGLSGSVTAPADLLSFGVSQGFPPGGLGDTALVPASGVSLIGDFTVSGPALFIGSLTVDGFSPIVSLSIFQSLGGRGQIDGTFSFFNLDDGISVVGPDGAALFGSSLSMVDPVSDVPLPAAAPIFLAGLGFLGALRRRQKTTNMSRKPGVRS